MDADKTIVHHGCFLEVETRYKVGTLIKFWYETKIKSGTLDTKGEKRYSYSKITRIIPKINNSMVVNLCYLTENEKFVEERQIVAIERKVDE